MTLESWGRGDGENAEYCWGVTSLGAGLGHELGHSSTCKSKRG